MHDKDKNTASAPAASSARARPARVSLARVSPANRRTIALAALAALVFGVVSCIDHKRHASPPDGAAGAPFAEDFAASTNSIAGPRPRIISLLPSVTETLYMLGLGGHLVARSQYCDFPPVVTNLPAVGSLGSANIEAIARLKPDFVLLPQLDSQSKIHGALAKLRINHIGIPANSLNDIIQSVWDLAERFDAVPIPGAVDGLTPKANAALWLERIDEVLAGAKASPPRRAPLVLFCAGRDPQSLDRIYISGSGNFYEDLIIRCGGKNAYDGKLATPMLSAEGVIKANPDIIIDVLIKATKTDIDNAITQWGRLASVNAVRTGDIHILNEAWAARPGPRIDLLAKTIAEYIREWDARQPQE